MEGVDDVDREWDEEARGSRMSTSSSASTLDSELEDWEDILIASGRNVSQPVSSDIVLDADIQPPEGQIFDTPTKPIPGVVFEPDPLTGTLEE